MGIDVYAVAIFCGTVVYVMRRRGPLGRGLIALAETLHHRIAHDRRVFESMRDDAREERVAIQAGLDAHERRAARQDGDLRRLAQRVDAIESRMGAGDGGSDA